MDHRLLRVGKGFDIHRLKPGLPFVLGGVTIPFEKGMDAHSDGDVLIHAVIDSLCGATGSDDIGTHFPHTDPRYKDVSSRHLLKRILEVIPSFTILNIDTVLYCEEPRLSPYREEIVRSLASILGISEKLLNLKCKTMEKTGPIGKGEAVAAEAVTLLLLSRNTLPEGG